MNYAEERREYEILKKELEDLGFSKLGINKVLCKFVAKSREENRQL